MIDDSIVNYGHQAIHKLLTTYLLKVTENLNLTKICQNGIHHSILVLLLLLNVCMCRGKRECIPHVCIRGHQMEAVSCPMWVSAEIEHRSFSKDSKSS